MFNNEFCIVFVVVFKIKVLGFSFYYFILFFYFQGINGHTMIYFMIPTGCVTDCVKLEKDVHNRLLQADASQTLTPLLGTDWKKIDSLLNFARSCIPQETKILADKGL